LHERIAEGCDIITCKLKLSRDGRKLRAWLIREIKNGHSSRVIIQHAYRFGCGYDLRDMMEDIRRIRAYQKKESKC